MSQHSKECCNKVKELEAENSIVTKEKYVVTEDEEERIEDYRDNVFYVAHFKLMLQDKKFVKTKKFMLRHNSEAAENDKFGCNKVFASLHKTLIS